MEPRPDSLALQRAVVPPRTRRAWPVYALVGCALTTATSALLLLASSRAPRVVQPDVEVRIIQVQPPVHRGPTIHFRYLVNRPGDHTTHHHEVHGRAPHALCHQYPDPHVDEPPTTPPVPPISPAKK